jgi:hypothetical protein
MTSKFAASRWKREGLDRWNADVPKGTFEALQKPPKKASWFYRVRPSVKGQRREGRVSMKSMAHLRSREGQRGWMWSDKTLDQARASWNRGMRMNLGPHPNLLSSLGKPKPPLWQKVKIMLRKLAADNMTRIDTRSIATEVLEKLSTWYTAEEASSQLPPPGRKKVQGRVVSSKQPNLVKRMYRGFVRLAPKKKAAIAAGALSTAGGASLLGAWSRRRNND